MNFSDKGIWILFKEVREGRFVLWKSGLKECIGLDEGD